MTTRTPPAPATRAPSPALSATSAPGRRWLAVLRIATGFVFLWAFLDKTFGFGYATPAARAWIHGGSPTRGYLTAVAASPLSDLFHAVAGAAWADWLFMLGLLGIGVALVLGIALRASAASGVLLLALMWLSEFPPARLTATGAPTGSTNPFVDYHLVYALVLAALAATSAGLTWGLGRGWARLPYIRDHAWTR